MEKQEIKLINDCIDLWGENSQIDILIEEMSELTKALLKQRRITPNWYNWFTVMEEFVDVSITLKIVEIILK